MVRSIADENADMMAQVLGRIVQPVRGGAVEFLARALERREARSIEAEALADQIAAEESPAETITRERDEREAERFRIELERDERGGDDWP